MERPGVSSALPMGTLGPPTYIRYGRLRCNDRARIACSASKSNGTAPRTGVDVPSYRRANLRTGRGSIAADRGVSQKTPVLALFWVIPRSARKVDSSPIWKEMCPASDPSARTAAHPCPLASFQLRGVVATYLRKQLPVAVWGAQNPVAAMIDPLRCVPDMPPSLGASPKLKTAPRADETQ
jgi:hypothetical protein